MSRRALFKFRLYVAGDALNSAQAVANLNALCRAHLPDRHEIEVVDVFREPKRALADDIRMTPTGAFRSEWKSWSASARDSSTVDPCAIRRKCTRSKR